MKLTEIRKKNNISQKELAKLLNMRQESISRYEIGKRQLPVNIAKKIGDLFQINWWELYEEAKKYE